MRASYAGRSARRHRPFGTPVAPPSRRTWNAEDGGTTTTRCEVTVEGDDAMAGEEHGSWSGTGGDCPNGRSSVSATRQP